ncbi:MULTISPECIES: aminomethyl-transferring glycine dehydrogenase [unclassified Mesorhizobium]|uniref:aminomethyl-transferring glycine dehydrogenase n=1 Tax=unclassified Mesorhizobium TaxID=325217 RepID=UPI00112DBAC1|nr:MULTISPECIES: aminomethyl-transferring glycine dehydrogenase [unclassified Mesorhizobium]MBZ9954165.1 aminomethyl-transferring glycine dehydrogenase [Mesorhizobium sp. BR1-1-15]TPI51657.1 aminomethyl-transferring glycine dehydrogenase [Mesorhizobium sp. B3-1-1]TPJ60483.1 aminomethyl-transferring glycine dehydrogenase [Mesorhizobium sp. B2-6-7]TPJ77949.1 aminomethyl-transferring glycine dehydrogenase [Mesorhizobium sp. B2-6-3]TPJ92509.1 aminomethyl-transferring glycine dehydrogenase [Mesorhi
MTAAPYPFSARHIGPGIADVRAMLAVIGVPSVETLISQAVPRSIRLDQPLSLPAPASEAEALAELSATMARNTVLKSFIGAGYHGVHVPPVIQRNLFENPAWYTAYTPYQAEISQGRLEMLFNFQTLVAELTGLPVASASLLDEATAVAEAIGIALRHHRDKRTKVALAGTPHPQTLDVARTRAEPLGIEIDGETIDDNTAALLVSWPDTFGVYGDHKAAIDKARAAGALVVFIADPLGLTLTDTPARLGADIAVGPMQRFGVPMGFGGPHAAYCAVADKLTRLMPGRLVGQSTDSKGRPGYRLALQTREQHIRRDKATSNICTAQALLANMATAYAIWHGPAGLQAIAGRIHALASRLAAGLKAAGLPVIGTSRFDTVTVETKGKAAQIAAAAEKGGRLLRVIDADRVGIAFDETSDETDLEAIAALFRAKPSAEAAATTPGKPRGKEFLTQPVFHENKSETEMMRFLRRLADKDLALDRAMIPLGSCTMKLNAAAEMMPVSWPEIANMHPFAPAAHSAGYRAMIDDLEGWLSEITGFDAVSLQPNAGSQGEYAGLLAIRAYHRSRGEGHRTVCLIPSSAHGTNPASAAMAGMSVVVVRCLEDGNIDMDDMRAKANEHSRNLAALMFTYPSTHGVYEEGARHLCALIHEHGGQVYFDGANLNALVGLARPGDIGADVCHMNLHKTFCIPHGGGGPGVGPIGVRAHLKPYLPGHVTEGSAHAVAAAPFGSASILPITWMYIRMMGASGLKQATETAIVSANYVATRLAPHFPLLYKGRSDRVAHECILDTRVLKESAGIGVEDIAKRLIDYGFHAPTMSFPVAGTLMVEPTESEPKRELDRFCEAMIAIAGEAAKVARGEWPLADNPLVNAPHTAAEALAGQWSHPYSRLEAAYPAGDPDMAAKYWPPVSRIDNVAGDRNLVCSCPPLSDYLGAAE